MKNGKESYINFCSDEEDTYHEVIMLYKNKEEEDEDGQMKRSPAPVPSHPVASLYERNVSDK